jgi:catechol 2,3-dioxygenase-like lactoylglutathione lyase family enzyme
MLSYLTIGTNDIRRAERFYTAVLGPLGYKKTEEEEGLAYTLAETCILYVKKPFDGREATVGNGSMLAFRVPTHAQLHALHSAGIVAGGTDEGPPGFRAQYSRNFFVGYLRDPLGNKLALFCTATEQPA